MMRALKVVTGAAIVSSLIACGGGGGGNTTAVTTPSIGIFLDSAVSGIGYKTATQSGTTNTKGEFAYLSGESVTFFVGGLELPTVTAKSTVTPLDIAQTTDPNDATAINILVLLQSLDEDGDPSNGIAIPSAAAANAPATIDFNVSPTAFVADSKIISFISNSGSVTTSPVSATVATQHFQTTLASIDNFYTPVISVADEAGGDNCEYGGEKILIGLDKNRNSTLDLDEVTGSQYRCNDSNPDVTAPTITTTAPEFATSFHTSFTTTFADDVELSFARTLSGSNDVGVLFAGTSSGTNLWFDENVNFKEINDSVAVALGGSYTGTYMAADMNGNVTKKKITIKAPRPKLMMGIYKTQSKYFLPEGYDCLISEELPFAPQIPLDGKEISTITISDSYLHYGGGYPTSTYSGWSISEGWAPSITASVESASIGGVATGIGGVATSIGGVATSIGGVATSLISLDGTTFDFSGNGNSSGSGPGYSYSYTQTGQITQSESDSKILNISLQQNCNINNAGYAPGVTATFDLAYLMAPIANISSSATSQTVGIRVNLYGYTQTNSTYDKTYVWTMATPNGSSATLSSTSTSSPTFTPDVAGDYIATLIVNDGVADSKPTSVTITAQ